MAKEGGFREGLRSGFKPRKKRKAGRKKAIIRYVEVYDNGYRI